MSTGNVLTEVPERGIRMQCGKCGRKWTYRGHKKHYASCPDCHTSVRAGTRGEAVGWWEPLKGRPG